MSDDLSLSVACASKMKQAPKKRTVVNGSAFSGLSQALEALCESRFEFGRSLCV